MSMEEKMDDVLGTNKQYNSEKLTQAKELVIKMAELCSNYEPDVVLLVLESAITETIHMASPTLGNLFEETMKKYKAQAAKLLAFAEILESHLNGEHNETQRTD
jgi:hypothetical protein